MPDPKANESKDTSKPGEAPASGAEASNSNPEGSGKPENERLSYLENELKKVVGQRDDLAKKAREREEAQLAETNNFKKLWEDTKPELETLRAKVAKEEARVDAKLAEVEKALSKEERVEYDQFIAKLPKEDRLEWADAKIRSRSTSSAPGSSPGAGSRPSHDSKTITQAQFSGMDPMARAQFFADGGKIAAA